MQQQARTSPPCPSLLQRLYGADNVLCLKDLLIRLSRLSTNANHLTSRLVHPHDHRDYAVRLLANTLCVISPSAPTLRNGFSLQQLSNQTELVMRAVEAMLRTPSQKPNVLAYGYRKRRDAPGGRQHVRGMTTAEAYHPNTVTAQLLSPPWQLLLSRIGDTLMLYLLMHTSLFARLPNSCCLQLCGPPLQLVAKQCKAGQGAAVPAALPPSPPLPSSSPPPATSLGELGADAAGAAAAAGVVPVATKDMVCAAERGGARVTDGHQGCQASVTQHAEQHHQQQGRGGLRAQQEQHPGASVRPKPAQAGFKGGVRGGVLDGVEGVGHAPPSLQGGRGRGKGARQGLRGGRGDARKVRRETEPSLVTQCPSLQPGGGGGGVEMERGSSMRSARVPAAAALGEGQLPGSFTARGDEGLRESPAPTLVVQVTELGDQQGQQAGQGGGHTGAAQGARRPRPSSWQRRKAARAREAQRAQQEGPFPDDTVPLSSPDIPPTQPVSDDVAADVAGVDQSTPAGNAGATEAADMRSPAAAAFCWGQTRGGGHHPTHRPLHPPSHRNLGRGAAEGIGPSPRKGPSRPMWPPTVAKPTDMVLPRNGVFYSASFPARPGFPAKHVLRRLQGQKGAARRLFAAIFHPSHNPVAGGVGARGGDTAARRDPPPVPARVPAGQRSVLPLLQRILDSLPKVPFAALLEHHCPLPPSLRRPMRNPRDSNPPSLTPSASPPALLVDTLAGPAATAGRPSKRRARSPSHPTQEGGEFCVREGRSTPAPHPRPGAAAVTPAVPVSCTGCLPLAAELDRLMDELHAEHESHAALRSRSAPPAAPGSRTAQLQPPAARRPPADLDTLMDELFACEQVQQAQRVQLQPQHGQEHPAQQAQHSFRDARGRQKRGRHDRFGSQGTSWGDEALVGVERRSLDGKGGRAEEGLESSGVGPAERVLWGGRAARHAARPAELAEPAELATQVLAMVPDSEDEGNGMGVPATQSVDEPRSPARDARLAGVSTGGGASHAGDGSTAGSMRGRGRVPSHTGSLPLNPLPSVPAGDGDLEAASGGRGGVHLLAPGSLPPTPPVPSPPPPPSLASQFVPHPAVAAFVWAVLRRLVPRQLLGSRSNRRRLQAAVRRFVALRRYEQMTVHQVLHGMKVTQCAWLRMPRTQGQHALDAAPGHASRLGRHPQRAQHGAEAAAASRECAATAAAPPQQAPLMDDPLWRPGLQEEGSSCRLADVVPGGDGAAPNAGGRTVPDSRHGRRKLSSQPLRGQRGFAQQAQQPGAQHVSPSQHSASQRRLALWLGWLFSAVVVPLLRAHFFCTESEAYRQQVFYYRKPVWVRLAQTAVQELQQTQFQAVGRQYAQDVLQARRLGVAKLRLLPKRTGMRVIANLGCSTTVLLPSRRRLPIAVAGKKGPGGGAGGFGYGSWGGVGVKRSRKTAPAPPLRLKFKPVNYHLQSAYQVLKYECSAQQEPLGGSVFGHNDAYCRLQPFIRTWRAACAAGTQGAAGAAEGRTPGSRVVGSGGVAAAGGGDSGGAGGRLFFVSVDVTRAFDHVDVDLLLEVVVPLIRHPQYWVVKYTEVVPSLGGALKVLYRRTAVPVTDPGSSTPPDFPAMAHRLAQTFRGKAFVDQVVYERVSREGVVSLLRQHLTDNLVKLRGRWHRQCRGIPQGSTLSTLLCSIYLAHLERTHLRPLMAAAAAEAGGGPPPAAEGRTGVGGVRGWSGAAAFSGTQSSSKGLLSLLAAEAGEDSCCARFGGSCMGGGGATPCASAPGAPSPSVVRGGGAAPVQQGGGSGGLPPPGTLLLLLRLVDDFLLITSQREVAAAVAERMIQGFPDFQVFVNPLKTKLSFHLAPGGACGSDGIPASLYRTTSGAEFIKWCGLLINVATLEVQGDYTRYVGEHISTTLTLPLRRRPGQALGPKLCQYLRPKIHPLLLDTAINSRHTIALNIYQAFLLGAMKFHCYVAALPSPPRGSTEGVGVLGQAIETGVVFMYSLTRRRRVRPATRPHARPVTCAAHVSMPQVRWLGLMAFQKVLRRKPARYGALLHTLQQQLEAPAMLQVSRSMGEVVVDSHSEVFCHIRY